MYTVSFPDHTADVAIECRADTLEELFTGFFEGLHKVVFGSKQQGGTGRHAIHLFSDTEEELLVAFLDEVNYLLQVKKIICTDIIALKMLKKMGVIELTGVIAYIKSEECEAEIETEIKAVTYHGLQILRDEKGLECRVLFDV